MADIKLNSIEDAVKDFQKGKFVIVVDDEDRENEGDLIIAAEKIDAEKVNFMLKNARGVLCAPATFIRSMHSPLSSPSAPLGTVSRYARATFTVSYTLPLRISVVPLAGMMHTIAG